MLEAHFTPRCSSVWTNTSDAITEPYNRTKDLFTLRCSFVAMVLDYDVTIKVLGFLIESWWGSVCVSEICRDLADCVSKLRAGCWLILKREIRYICAKDQTHTCTPTETQLLRESHWFSCCCAGASITIKHHYCADHFRRRKDDTHAHRLQMPCSLLGWSRVAGSLSCMNWIKLFVSQYQDIWSCPITNTNRNILPRRNRTTFFYSSLQPTGLREYIYPYMLWKVSSDNETTWLPTVQLKICMYISIFCVTSSVKHGKSKQRLFIRPVFKHLVTSLYVCVRAQSACTPACLSVCLTADCVVAQGNSCRWGFLYEHVNKGEPPKSSPVCPPANENWAPSWDQPVDGEEGRDSAPWGKNSSKAQSFESGTGTDSRAITKTLPL